MSTNRISLTLICTMMLAGCASVTAKYEATKHDYALPASGSYIHVNQDLRAPRGARIYIQHGQVLKFNEVYKLAPYCEFYVNRSSDELRTPLTINSDQFLVKRVYRRKDIGALAGMQYALNGKVDGNNGASQRNMSTYLELRSNLQPEVARLVCTRWADPYDYNHLRLSEIKQSLGQAAELVSAK